MRETHDHGDRIHKSCIVILFQHSIELSVNVLCTCTCAIRVQCTYVSKFARSNWSRWLYKTITYVLYIGPYISVSGTRLGYQAARTKNVHYTCQRLEQHNILLGCLSNSLKNIENKLQLKAHYNFSIQSISSDCSNSCANASVCGFVSFPWNLTKLCKVDITCYAKYFSS